MALSQTQTISKVLIVGDSLSASLSVDAATVRLTIVATAANRAIASVSEPVGSSAANTLVGYVDTASGALTPAGETFARTLTINTPGASGTVGDYFA